MNKLKSIANTLLSVILFVPTVQAQAMNKIKNDAISKTIVKGKLLKTTIRPAIVLDNEND
jgi:hypothetical protein